MDKRQISTGEAAKITGLTIRTLQHYDNIGVLPASGRTEGGRRYYTEDDMMKLEHVVFYRGLGFSLEQIKEKLLNKSMEDGADELLAKQKVILYNQIDNLQNSIAAIEACQAITTVGKTPPWMLLATFMQSLGTVDLMEWTKFNFSDEQVEIITEHLPTMDNILDFYATFRRLSIKAAAYHEAGINPNDVIAQKLAAEWDAMTQKATGGKQEHEKVYLEIDQQRGSWNKAERELLEKAEQFLENAIKIFHQSK